MKLVSGRTCPQRMLKEGRNEGGRNEDPSEVESNARCGVHRKREPGERPEKEKPTSGGSRAADVNSGFLHNQRRQEERWKGHSGRLAGDTC